MGGDERNEEREERLSDRSCFDGFEGWLAWIDRLASERGFMDTRGEGHVTAEITG